MCIWETVRFALRVAGVGKSEFVVAWEKQSRERSITESARHGQGLHMPLIISHCHPVPVPGPTVTLVLQPGFSL